jgi:hypothetical protein
MNSGGIVGTIKEVNITNCNIRYINITSYSTSGFSGGAIGTSNRTLIFGLVLDSVNENNYIYGGSGICGRSETSFICYDCTINNIEIHSNETNNVFFFIFYYYFFIFSFYFF